jgi:NADH-quinone oxidoreductase subunit L
MNRIGDLGFLLGIILIFINFESIDYLTVFDRAKGLTSGDNSLMIITLLLFVGAMGKSAQIPLYTWLPDAMAGPTPVSALIHAATMVTAGIYMIARSNILYTLAETTSSIVAIIGLATAILAATIALKQNDIKKVLAYSTVSQLGFMFLALGVGAFTGAVFHVMTHAFFKALLFLGAGSVIHGMHHEQDLRAYGGLKKWMPVTHITMLIGCIAIAGIPGFSGFFSKDEILMGAYAKNPVYYYLGLGAALMTAFYIFRLYAMTFLGNYRGNAQHHPHESPAAMTLPLIVLAALSIVGGYVGIPELFAHNSHKLADFLAPVFAESNKLTAAHAIDHNTEWILLGVSSILIIAMIIWAVKKFAAYKPADAEETGLSKVLANKWYVDEIYEAVIVRPIGAFSSFLWKIFDVQVVDRIVVGFGRVSLWSGEAARTIQTGSIQVYALMLLLGLIATTGYLIYVWI